MWYLRGDLPTQHGPYSPTTDGENLASLFGDCKRTSLPDQRFLQLNNPGHNEQKIPDVCDQTCVGKKDGDGGLLLLFG